MKTTEEKIEVMQAFLDGETLQFDNRHGDWYEVIGDPVWSWNENDYRIAPKEKIKLYKWAFKVKGENKKSAWGESASFYKSSRDCLSCCGGHVDDIIRLDYTMIEVDQ